MISIKRGDLCQIKNDNWCLGTCSADTEWFGYIKPEDTEENRSSIKVENDSLCLFLNEFQNNTSYRFFYVLHPKLGCIFLCSHFHKLVKFN